MEFDYPTQSGQFDIEEIPNFKANLNNLEGQCIYLCTQGSVLIPSDKTEAINFEFTLENLCNGNIKEVKNGVVYNCVNL